MTDHMDKRTRAIIMASEAAQIDFEGALAGLLSGHRTAMDKIREDRAALDMSFLMALTLTEKGSRLDRDGMLARSIADGISRVSMSKVEKEFIARADADSKRSKARATQGETP